jgi:hypothetical protein
VDGAGELQGQGRKPVIGARRMLMDRQIMTITSAINSYIEKNGGQRFAVQLFTERESLTRYHFPIDYRVVNGNYDFFIILLVTEKSTNMSIYCSNFICFLKNNYDKQYFWKHDKNTLLLKRVALNDIITRDETLAMTVGYSMFCNDITLNVKYTVSKFFIGLVRALLLTDICLFMETQGCEVLGKELLCSESIDIHEPQSALLDINNIGMTRDASKTTEKFAAKMGLVEVNNIYNYYTLGKVFISPGYQKINGRS